MIGFDLKIDGEFTGDQGSNLQYYDHHHTEGAYYGMIVISDGMLNGVRVNGLYHEVTTSSGEQKWENDVGVMTFDNLQSEKTNYGGLSGFPKEWVNVGDPMFHLNIINANEPVRFSYECDGKLQEITLNPSDIENIKMIEIQFDRANVNDINSIIHIIK